MKYRTEVKVRKLPKELLLSQYRKAEEFSDSCRLCPDYGKVWSCPPGIPDAWEYLEPYEEAFVVVVKLLYSEQIQKLAATKEKAAEIRAESYEQVKKELLLTLLALEKEMPKGKCMGAGRCILCRQCAREFGKPCRHPEQRRYSMTAFGFDFTGILRDFFDTKLLWSGEGLPEYDTAVAALFVK